MMKNKVALLFLKIVILSSPIILLLISYIYYDPFRVIRKYSNYHKDCFVALNRDYISTEVYLSNIQKYNYNAFIFGNSRSLAFLCNDWKKHIGKNNSTFHYDASSETLKGLTDKVKFIDNSGGKLDIALIVLDRHLLELTDYLDGALYLPHPVTRNSSWFSFETFYFKSYLSEFYFIKYIDFFYTKKYKSYMKGVIETRPIEYINITNDIYLKIFDEALEENPSKYINEHINFYNKRDTINKTISKPVIGINQISYLNEIQKVFSKQKTKYKIVIGPLYELEYINQEDLKILVSIFGKDNVYDFSGKNEFSRHIENFYESFHYRPKVARGIMEEIYK
jgi:hypothetical protein